MDNSISSLKNQYRLASREFKKIENALYEWFLAQSKFHITAQKSLQWSKFKKHYGIRLLSLLKSSLSSTKELVRPVVKKLASTIMEHGLSKTRSFSKRMNPVSTGKCSQTIYFVYNGEKSSPGRKLLKEGMKMNSK